MIKSKGWKLKLTTEESIKVQKHAAHFGYKWFAMFNAKPEYKIRNIENPYIFFNKNQKEIYQLVTKREFDSYTNYTTITVKDFLNLTL